MYWPVALLQEYFYSSRGIWLFFFSSRRRHTRFKCDWSSDVCSSDLSQPLGITAGPDGALWFVESSGNKIGRIATNGTILGETFIPTTNSQPVGITAGPDGNLWFTEFAATANKIAKITPAGAITEFSIPTASSSPFNITTGPDGNLWFTEPNGEQIGRITVNGAITEFPIPTPNGQPNSITTGPDGNLWFSEIGSGRIGQITPAGFVAAEFIVPPANSSPTAITVGPHGSVVFAEFGQAGDRLPLLHDVLDPHHPLRHTPSQ